MTQLPHESFPDMSTIQAQQLISALLEKPHDGSPEDLAELIAGFNTVDTRWQEEWDAFDPETTEVITRFVRTFWDDTNVQKTMICLDYVGTYDLYPLIGLVATGAGSMHPYIRWQCLNTLRSLSFYDQFARSIFLRLNVIRRLVPDDLVPAEAKVAEAVVRDLRDSLPLTMEKRQGAVPRNDLLEALKTVLGRRWMTVLRRVWLLNLMADYRSVFSSDHDDISDFFQSDEAAEKQT